MSSLSNRPVLSWSLTAILLAGSLLVTGSSVSGQVERAVRTETLEDFRLEAEGYDNPSTYDFELSNRVELDGVSSLIVDTFVMTMAREGIGWDGFHIRFAVLADGVEVLSAQGMLFSSSAYTDGVAERANRDVVPTDLVADAFRVSIWASRVEPGGEMARVSVFPLGEELRLHFVKGARSVHERRAVFVAEQSLAGPGPETTDWQEHNFDEPVTAAQLTLVEAHSFGFDKFRAVGASECQLLLDGDPDRYLTLDDAFSPSRGEPSTDWCNDEHSLHLDMDARIRLLDRSVVGFRWRMHQTEGGEDRSWLRMGGREVIFDFFYDDGDCDGDGLTDIEELAMDVAVDDDGDAVPDDCGEEVRFQRGDANADARTDLSDAVFVLASLFTGGDEPSCFKAADANDGGTVDISDAVYILSHLFLGGPEPSAPFVECGTDPTVDDLSCESFGPCEG